MSFNDDDYIELPDWTLNLRGLYFVLRVDARRAARRRKYYRLVEREKLRLAEMGIDQQQIKAVCRYLCCLKASSKLRAAITFQPVQMSFDFV